MEAFCVKCKKAVEAKGEIALMKNRRKAFKGNCPICGTKVFKFVK